MNYLLEISEVAEGEILGIESRVALNSPKNAKAITDNLVKSMRNLTLFPKMGVALKGKFGIDTNFRALFNSKYPYVTIYEVIDKTVYILRVLPSKSEYIKTLGF
ncbi:MAG: type II toxin-antitoxin system RelE/ParE family toxin [Firmicutes bacterium]|nr:type II toxin-antitoxin system RelE/ParE family toxin [Bacillota bacterium]